MMNRAMEHFSILQANDKLNFFVTHADIPFKLTDYTLEAYVTQMRLRVLGVMHEKYGVDVSDAALWKALEVHNKVCAILTELIEGCGAFVAADRYCFGSAPGREVIEVNESEDLLTQICRHYLEMSECPRFISDEKVHQRRETADRLAREFGAEGIIYEQMKYCDYWGFERALVSHVMQDEYQWPVLSVDHLYNNGSSGQLRTRVQAFVESLEIKRIRRQGGKG